MGALTISPREPTARQLAVLAAFAEAGDYARTADTLGMSDERELIGTGTDKRYVRRDEKSRFKESDDEGRASAAARRQGDNGDRKG